MTKVLVVGAGISGLSTALVLGRQGHEVDLIERNESVKSLGSGITLIGPALRALSSLGVVQDCIDQGFAVTKYCVHTSDGDPVVESALPPSQPGLPPLLGMTRPTLHAILHKEAVRQGATIRTALSPVTIDDRATSATVEFSDGSCGDYDLVVAADGLRSSVRALVFGAATPEFHEQVCMRAVLPRPSEINQEMVFHGVDRRHVGFTPIGPDTMYLYCVAPVVDAIRPAQDALPGLLREFLADFGGPVGAARELITDPALVNYAPLETIVSPEPWYSGHVVLVGDAAHATTPQLAAGAAMCLEDAVVLGEEMNTTSTVSDALSRYSKRRFDRARYVVETSVQLAEWQMDPQSSEEAQHQLVSEAIAFLAESC